MTKPFIAAACLAVCAIQTAHAAVVQQTYSGYVTGVASPTGTASVGNLSLNPGVAITGSFVYDNELLGGPRSPFDPVPAKREYRGAPVNNHITVSADGQAFVAAPDSASGACSSPLDIINCADPVVMRVRSSLSSSVLPSDILSLTYAPFYNPPFVTVGDTTPVRVSSVTMDFFYQGELAGNGLPTQIDFESLSYAQMMLNLSDGSGVFVKLMAISAPVPEAGTLSTMALGLVGVAAVVGAQRRRLASVTPAA
jgi:hypothetical protein